MMGGNFQLNWKVRGGGGVFDPVLELGTKSSVRVWTGGWQGGRDSLEEGRMAGWVGGWRDLSYRDRA